MTVIRPPMSGELGLLAADGTQHVFSGGTICRWCYGSREDPRHWLPRDWQAAYDAAIGKEAQERWEKQQWMRMLAAGSQTRYASKNPSNRKGTTVSDIRAALLGRLPSGDGNGLAALASELSKDPKRIRVGIILFDADRIVEKTDDGNHEARVRLRRVEAIQDTEDAAALQRILMRSFERRTGATVLPLELEEDVNDAFAGLEQLAAMKDGNRPANCAECGVEVRYDAAGDVWVDGSGYSTAGDGHNHTPQPPEQEAS